MPVTLGLLNKLACEVAERDGRDRPVIALLAKFGVKHLATSRPSAGPSSVIGC